MAEAKRQVRAWQIEPRDGYGAAVGQIEGERCDGAAATEDVPADVQRTVEERITVN